MQSKKLSSDLTIIKKDLTRYAPVWCSLCAMLVLTAITVREEFQNYGLNELPYFPYAMYFAPVSALAVFGYLHNHTESCAVHALPIRRERLFVLHTVSAFLMFLIPMAIFLIAVDPYCKNSLISMLLWSALEFAWLFSMAAFCMMVTGRKIGAALLYIFIQVLPILIAALLEFIYLPELPGVYIDTYAFLFSPSTLVASIPELYEDGILMKDGHLALLVTVGLTLAVFAAAMLLYRKRHMERSGDLLSVKWLDPVFAVCSGITGICALHVLFSMSNEGVDWTLFLLGLAVGYFGYWMLSKKSARVFSLKNLAGYAALTAVMVGSVFVTRMDPFGRVGYVPDVNRVETVSVMESLHFDRKAFKTSDPAEIEEVLELHAKAVDDHKASLGTDYCRYPQTIAFVYELENGGQITREYYLFNQALMDELSWYLSQPIAQFGTDDPQVTVHKVYYNDTYIWLDREECDELVALVLQECRAGNMEAFGSGTNCKWSITMTDAEEWSYYLDVPYRAEALLEWLNAHLEAE